MAYNLFRIPYLSVRYSGSILVVFIPFRDSKAEKSHPLTNKIISGNNYTLTRNNCLTRKVVTVLKLDSVNFQARLINLL